MNIAEKLKNAKPQTPPENFGDIDPEKKRYSEDTRHRKRLVYWVMGVVTVWLICIFVFLLLYGFGCIKAEALVVETLLATTTANILGLPYIVLKGLFHVNTHNE